MIKHIKIIIALCAVPIRRVAILRWTRSTIIVWWTWTWCHAISPRCTETRCASSVIILARTMSITISPIAVSICATRSSSVEEWERRAEILRLVSNWCRPLAIKTNILLLNLRILRRAHSYRVGGTLCLPCPANLATVLATNHVAEKWFHYLV